MQILKRFPDTIAANMARANLARHGIDAFVADEMLANAGQRWPTLTRQLYSQRVACD
ncbi:MAG: hypothetical protein ACI9R3_000023 [Verrucomicrobiales bacterium]|jgi:hypothetical protein